MLPSAKPLYEVASAVSLGKRALQEDALITDFPIGSEFGFAVLADGMGGHAAGDVASKIVVTEVFRDLKLHSGQPERLEDHIGDVLRHSMQAANNRVQDHSGRSPETAGMGATLVAPVFFENRLYWISVGDSPLYLFRGDYLVQLNEDHSMAPQFDYLARSGMMESEEAENHPDRNCLTSVLIGDRVPRIDCPAEPVQLMPGDILVVSSDGLQFLTDKQIASLLKLHGQKPSSEIVEILLRQIDNLNDPDQDNVSFSVIKFHGQAEAHAEAQAPAYDDLPATAPQHDEQIGQPARTGTNSGQFTMMAQTTGKRVSVIYRDARSARGTG